MSTLFRYHKYSKDFDPQITQITQINRKNLSNLCNLWIAFAVLIVSILASACGSADPTPAPVATVAATETANHLLIVAMGDSLTEGLGVASEETYPAQLERKLWADGYGVTVINAGVSGETSTGAMARVQWVLQLKPQIVILATGGNDSLRGIDPALTQANLSQLVQTFQAEGIVVVLAGMKTVQNMGEEYTSAFEAIYPAVAQENQTILIPFLLEGVGGKADLNQPDFIHPTGEGYAVVVEVVYPYVVEAIAAKKDKSSFITSIVSNLTGNLYRLIEGKKRG